MDDAYHVLADKIKNGGIPFNEAEECAKLWGVLGIDLHFWNWHTNIIQEYMEAL